MHCANDPQAGGNVCEYACSSLSDCPNLGTTCAGDTCAVIGCGGSTGNGIFDGLCDAVGTNDGTCVPLTDDGTTSLGFCVLGGSTTTNCDPSADRKSQSAACPAGSMCYGGLATFGGSCSQLCDPSGNGLCPQGQFCSTIVNEPNLGICIGSGP